jgi:hypothetical protein
MVWVHWFRHSVVTVKSRVIPLCSSAKLVLKNAWKTIVLTALMLTVIAFKWWKANERYQQNSGLWYGRRRGSWVWCFIGAGIGSFLGNAGFGTAIAGTLPGAVIGYFTADYLLLRNLLRGQSPDSFFTGGATKAHQLYFGRM